MKVINKRLVSWMLIMSMMLSIVFSGLTPALTANAATNPLQSPVIGTQTSTDAQVTFNYQGDGTETRVIVKGSFNNWQQIEMTEGSDHVWSYTGQIPSGWYEYGIATYPSSSADGNWKADPLNPVHFDNGNPGVSVPGLQYNGPHEALIGETTVIDSVYYTGTQGTMVQPTLSISAKEGVSLSGNNLVVADDATPGSVEVTANYNTASLTRTVQIVGESLASPVINGDGSVTFNAVNNAENLYLVGSLNGWDIANAIPLTKTNGIFSKTLNLVPGEYQYKFAYAQNWGSGDTTDILNPFPQKGSNSVVYVPGIVFDFEPTIAKNSELALEAHFQTDHDQRDPIAPGDIHWSLKEPVDGVTLANGKISSTKDAEATVVASYNGYTSEATITIGEMFTYKINYYRFNDDSDQWNMWLFPDQVNGKGYAFTGKTEEGYHTAEYKFPSTKLNIVTRKSTAENDWASQEMDRKIDVPAGDTSVEVWIVEGIEEVFYTKPADLEALRPLDRRIQFKYVRADKDYRDWNIWTWSTGKTDGEVKFDWNTWQPDEQRDTTVATIHIGPKTSKIGFKLRKGSNWNTAIIDQDFDREIITGNEELTKVIVYGGQGAIKTIPAASAPVLADGTATFFYRDEQLFRQNEMHLITSVQVKLDGVLYPMNYIAEDERFVFTSLPLTEGNHLYTYLVTKDGVTTEVTDPKNTVDGQSMIIYKKPKMDIISYVEPGMVSYNDNAVLTVGIEIEDEADLDEAAVVKEIYADLTVLGGKEKTVIDPQLKAITIGVSDTVPTGSKSFPVTVVDIYGNKYRAPASVQVVARQVDDANDFDWDEARIYFMLTDRFFNGDSSNDDPNGEGYDNSHPETYHGGDLKGITAKLDYLEELGINTIWISPIVDNIDFNKGVDFNSNQYGYHGYWAKDFTSIDEHQGELEDLKQLIDAAHDKGIKIMVDVVLNHTGYGMDELATAWAGLQNLPTAEERAVFDGMIRTEDEDPEVRYELAGLPDLKTEEVTVREQIIAWQTDWLEKARTDKGNSIDYFRVDTVKHVENTTWMAFKNELTSINPAFKLIGENFGASVDSDGGYMDSGMMDSQLDFRFKGIAANFVNGRVDSVENELESRDTKLDNTSTFGQFLSSHDEDGFLYSLLSDEDRVEFRAGTLDADVLMSVQAQQKIAASLQITSKGQPVVYYGEEIGQSGNNAGDMAAGVFSGNRDDFDWTKLDNPTYNHILNHYKKMLNIRKDNSKVFSKGTRTKIAGSDADGYLVFSRAYNGEQLTVGINTSEEAKTIEFQVPYSANSVLKDLYSDTNLTVNSSGKVTVTLPSSLDGGTFVLKLVSNGSNGDPGPSGGSSLPAVDETRVPASSVREQGKVIATADMKLLEKAIIAASTTQAKQVTVIVNDAKAGEAADVIIPAAAFKQAKAAGVSIVVQFEGVTITLPAGAIDDAVLAGSEQIVVSKQYVSDAEAERIKKGITALDPGYRAIGHLFNFSIASVNAENVKTAFKNFKGKVQVKVALTSDELKAIVDKRKAGVYYVGEDGKLEFKGGKFSDKDVTFHTDHFSNYIVMEYSKTFADVQSGWAKTYVELLAARHITTGVDANHFNPGGKVTRAEFAVFLGRALGLDESAND
ncbi:MAG: alpha-amylase family glycosyl hydrolase, partial [Candidatus Pristimantibacillus sp.]